MENWQIEQLILTASNVIEAYDGTDGKKIIPGDSRWVEELRDALTQCGKIIKKPG